MGGVEANLVVTNWIGSAISAVRKGTRSGTVRNKERGGRKVILGEHQRGLDLH